MRIPLPSGRRKHRALAATLAAAAALTAPAVAHAQLFTESWEPNNTSRWVASSTVNTYNETGTASTLRSSVADGADAACAGRYARESIGTSGGRMFTKIPAGIPIAANTTYCLMAFIRSNAAGVPYLGINFEATATMNGAGSSTDNECWLIGTAGFSNTGTAGFYCPSAAANQIGNNPASGAVPAASNVWTFVTRQFTTGASVAAHNFAHVKYEHFCGSASCGGAQTAEANGPDFDDIRLIAGTCPATPPADMAPHVPCTGTTPICELGGAAANAKCAECNGDFGNAAATRACPTAAAGICVTAGALKGSCRPPCSGDFGSGGGDACPETAPFCKPPGQPTAACKACNGNAGSGASEACAAASPNCFTTGAKSGSCGKCTANTECPTSAPRCDTTSGLCTNDCTKDEECGDKTSGKVCNTSKCSDGCRGTDGNGCPTGKKCTSTNATIGQCVDDVPTSKDRDNDGISDEDEVRLGLNPDAADTDGDGLFDGAELGADKVKGTDSDGDGKIDANDSDDDDDGIPTADEISKARSANLTDDVDGDGRKNWLDTDSDNDGVTDREDGIGDQNSNGRPDFLDNTWPVQGGTSNLDPNPTGALEGGGCAVAPGVGSRANLGLLGIGLGLTALFVSRRRR